MAKGIKLMPRSVAMERPMGNISATVAACAIKLDKKTAPIKTAASATKGFVPLFSVMG